MAINPQVQNVKLGACTVKYGGVDLGLTKGGVEVTITTNTHEVKVDQFGDTVVNDYVMGRIGQVTVPMAETDLQKLQAVIPGATLVTDENDAEKKKLLIPTGAGLSLYELADELVLHPKANAADNKADDVVIPLAAPAGNIQFAFQVENERVYSITFTMYPDADGLLCIFGDPDAEAAAGP